MDRVEFITHYQAAIELMFVRKCNLPDQWVRALLIQHARVDVAYSPGGVCFEVEVQQNLCLGSQYAGLFLAAKAHRKGVGY